MASEKSSGSRAQRSKVGTVCSAAGDKTIRVAINSLVKHPMYGKYMRRRTKLAVHDAQNSAQVGDVVEVLPCRRLSKNKSWRLVRVVKRSALPAGPVTVAAPATEGAAAGNEG